MPNNDVKIDHEAAKMVAERLSGDPAYRVMVKPAKLGTIARAYLDLLAQRDEADKLRDVAYGLLDVAVKERDEAREELAIFKRRRISETYLDGIEAQRDEALALLEEAAERLASFSNMTGPKIRAFLAKHRKTGASHGK